MEFKSKSLFEQAANYSQVIAAMGYLVDYLNAMGDEIKSLGARLDAFVEEHQEPKEAKTRSARATKEPTTSE